MRYLMGLAAAAMFVSSVAFSAAPASAGPMMGHMRCPHGTHWVAPYQRHGHWVKGYCRR